jgi:hypothetical protein
MAYRAPRPHAVKHSELQTRLARITGSTLFVLFIGLVGLMAERAIPPQHLPWRPLRLIDPVGAATAVKAARAGQDPALCRAILRKAGVTFTEFKGETTPQMTELGCSTRDAIVIDGGMAALAPGGVVMSCSEALSLSIWERQVVQPAAYDLLGAGVSRIDQYGGYSCRRIYGGATGNLSEHALANALDVGGVRLTDGGSVSVKDDWAAPGKKGQFLHRIRDQGCKVFGTVLSPDYNAAHHDHLHLDMGQTGVCR